MKFEVLLIVFISFSCSCLNQTQGPHHTHKLKEHNGTKMFRTTQSRIGVGWYAWEILKRNECWSKKTEITGFVQWRF